MGAYFAPVYSTVIRTSFAEYYSHQTGGRLLEFADITFSTSAPYISVNLPWYIFNQPKIDAVISAVAFVNK